MRAEGTGLRLIQLVGVLLTVPLDAFALVPGRVKGAGSATQYIHPAGGLNGRHSAANQASSWGIAVAHGAPATSLRAGDAAISGGGAGGQVRKSQMCYFGLQRRCTIKTKRYEDGLGGPLVLLCPADICASITCFAAPHQDIGARVGA